MIWTFLYTCTFNFSVWSLCLKKWWFVFIIFHNPTNLLMLDFQLHIWFPGNKLRLRLKFKNSFRIPGKMETFWQLCSNILIQKLLVATCYINLMNVIIKIMCLIPFDTSECHHCNYSNNYFCHQYYSFLRPICCCKI